MERSTLLRYADLGDGSAESRIDLAISYRHDSGRYLHSLPENITVSDKSGVLRQRTAEYDDKGRLIRHASQIDEQTGAVFDFEYDVYGNITKVTRPENYRGQRFWYSFAYDPMIHTLPVRIEDAFGYKSSTEYDYKFAVPVKTVDLNGREMRYSYDSQGRPVTILAPLEIKNGAPYTIRYQYYPGAATPYAVTSHCLKDLKDEKDVKDVRTYTFVDGFSRPLQIKKTSVIYNEATGQDEEKLTVSGRVEYDAFGRTAKTYLPVAENTGKETVFNPTIDTTSPTVTEYDVKDRPVRVMLPDGAESRTQFAIVEVNGLRTLRQTLTDAEGNSSESYADVRGRTVRSVQKSGKGDAVVDFRFNVLGEVLETVDPRGFKSFFTYDKLGRRLSSFHPDGGLTTFEYDKAGNVLFKQTANLKAIGNDVKVKYTYDYERPFEIIYPKNVHQRITYSYGAPDAAHNRAGRMWLVQDASGAQEFFFDELGNTTKTIRTVMPTLSDMRTYIWEERRDTWGRVREMVYPDGEKVTYSYNAAGQLQGMKGEKLGREYSYITKTGYDLQDRIVYRQLGNGTETHYSYEKERQRLETMQLASGSAQLLDLKYKYDKVDNILSLIDQSPVKSDLGGPFQHKYDYDEFYRLVYAEGFQVQSDTSNYTLSLEYDIMGSPVQKIQTVNNDSSKVDYAYNDIKPHAASQIGTRAMEYDLNGNLEYWTDTVTNDYRRLLWNEENQLLGVEDNGYINRYLYDAAGERIVKAHGGMQGVFINGAPVNSIMKAEKITVYVSPYMTVTGERFTKHYYAGTQRIVSKIGNGSFANLYRPGNNILLAGNINCVDRYNQIEAGKTEYIKSLGIPPGPPTMKGIYGEPENTGSAFPDSGTPTNEAPKNWPRKPVQAPPGGPPGPPIQYGPEITNETAEAGFGYTSTGYIEESDRYFYHSDHLGSTAYITDRNGKVTQFMAYMPFGETLVDKHASKNEMPYKFNGKEKDEETGLYYYGARYYNDRDILWISVDPLWEKYPGVSAYNYCHNNPVRFVDPDGKDPTLPFSPWSNKKMERLVQYGTIAQNNGSQAVSASISISTSAWGGAVKANLGPILAEGNVEVIKASGKASTDKLSASITGAELSGKLAVEGTASVQANATIGKAEASFDGTNVKAETSIGSIGANAQVSVNERSAKIDNKATVGIGVKLSVVKAEISVKLDKAVTWFAATVAAIGTMITPEIKVPDEVKRKH